MSYNCAELDLSLIINQSFHIGDWQDTCKITNDFTTVFRKLQCI